MASIAKYASERQIEKELGHGARTNKYNPPHIDAERLDEDYILSPAREMTPYRYFQKRKAELHCMNRADVKKLVEVVVTLPKDADDELLFFNATHAFLEEFFGGAQNCVLSAVHKDEEGQPHMHFYAIPVEYDTKKGYEKISSSKLLSREVLCNFHDKYDVYLKQNGVNGTVKSGITKRQGGNKTVHQLKQEREIERERRIVHDW